MITTSWSIKEMQRRKHNGEVYYVVLECSVGIGSTVYASADKAFTLPKNSSPNDMIAYNDLTESQVIGWAKQVWNNYAPIEEESFREAVTQAALDKINNNIQVTWENESGMPWN